MFFGTISPSSTCSTTTIGDRDDERHRVQHGIRDAEQVERLLQQMRDRGLADAAQQDRTDGDAQLGTGQHQRQVLAGADDGHRAVLALLGKGFQPVAARRDQRELRGDEERVGARAAARSAARRRSHPSVPLLVVRRGGPASSAPAGRSGGRPSGPPSPASAPDPPAARRDRTPSARPTRPPRGCGRVPAAPARRSSRIRLRARGIRCRRRPRRCAAAPTPASRDRPARRRRWSRRVRRGCRRRSPR